MAQGNSMDSVSEEVLELIVAKLPAVSVLEAAQVCKNWLTVVRSRRFANFYDQLACRKSWFFQCCVNYLLPEKNQGYGYDPESKQWHKLSPQCFQPEQDKFAMASSPDGLLYSIFTLSDLTYKREFLSKQWSEAPPMKYSRNAPLLGVVDSPDAKSHKLLVAGGVSFFEDDDLALEIYDSASRSWEVCESLPREFRNNSSRHWMTSAVVGGRFFVAEVYTGLIASFDLQSMRWSAVGTLRPAGVVHSHLLAIQGSLFLGGSCYSEDKHSFKIWRVNVAAQECGVEIASMPSALCKIFGPSDDGGPERKGEGIQCVASGDLIYIFSREQYRDNQVVVCDLSSRGADQWSLLPPLPATGSFNHVVVVSSPVKIASLF
ncbi:hypothetical protein Mapa_002364 [Marchantia paleacea]|nr:hypothetical protein Mapa_002364 [Marchantia paleacea]